MRKFILCFVALITVLSAIPFCSAKSTEDLEKLIYESSLYEQEADITQYKLLYEDFNKVFEQMRAAGKLPWYTDDGYTYTYNETTKLLLAYTPKSKDPTVYDRTLYSQKLAAFMEECILPGMTPLQIALSVHDHMILNNIYDSTLEKNTGYDLLVHGTTVCAGYADLYTRILNSVGIPCITVTSTEMDHAWNLVQLDGNWYHVDVTWDDPTPDCYGRARHTYFLLTDEEISTGEEPHYAWDSNISCTDTRYSNAYWRNVENAILFESSDVSYLIRNEDWDNRIYRRNEATGEETLLFTDTDHYVNTGDGGYAFVHRGIGLADGRIFFNRQDTICSMKTDGSDVKTEFQWDTKTNRQFIYGFHLDGKQLHITLADQKYNPKTLDTQIDWLTAPHEHNFTVTTQPPVCIEAGYTLSVCECGLESKSDLVPPAGHQLKVNKKKIATFFGDGYEEGVCTVCSEVATRVLPKIDFAKWVLDNSSTILLVCGAVVFLVAVLPTGGKKSKTSV